MMPRLLTISCLQTSPRPTFATAREEAIALAEMAIGKGPSLICLPEYCGGLRSDEGRFVPPHAKEDEHPVLLALKDFAKKNKVWICVGSVAITGENGRYFNRSLLLDNNGDIKCRYDKIHLFDINLADNPHAFKESATVQFGNQISLAETPFGTIGFSVCYDLRFAHIYREMAQNGAEILLVPSAFTKKTGEAHWHILNRARAIENGAFVIAPCASGLIEGGGDSYGHSLVVDPWGEILADGGVGSGVITSQIDLQKVEKTRMQIPSLQHDRDYQLEIIDASGGSS